MIEHKQKYDKHFHCVVILIVLAITFATCKKGIKRCNLRELTHSELFKNALNAKFIPFNTPIFSLSNQLISRDSASTYDRLKLTYGQYVDCNDSIVKLVIKPISEKDIDLRKRIDSLYRNSMELMIKRIKWVEQDTLIQKEMIEMAAYIAPLKLLPVICDSIKKLLKICLKSDQQTRSLGKIDLADDRHNLEIIESIFKSCGYSTIEKFGKDAVFACFMIIQHARPPFREKYIDYFHHSTEKGLLGKSSLALMIDRMLIDQGKKQLYGTQFQINSKTGESILLPLASPLNVDSFRNLMNLMPLKYYLSNHNIKEK